MQAHYGHNRTSQFNNAMCPVYVASNCWHILTLTPVRKTLLTFCYVVLLFLLLFILIFSLLTLCFFLFPFVLILELMCLVTEICGLWDLPFLYADIRLLW